MQTWQIVLLIVLAVLIVVAVVLYFLGKRLEKQQDENEARLEVGKQTVSMLVIDKKRMKLKEAGLPDIVVQQTPWYLKGSKVPVVKAKVGPRVVTMVADEKIFDLIPTKKEVKAVINGIYIMDVRGVRGAQLEKPVKLTWRQKIRKKLLKAQDDNKAARKAAEASKDKDTKKKK
ncbi:MAG: hypothetical protein IJR36_02715 [Lachnospiraceae bacterium]|nr:hypothetical protein [Lachnospiraceae bacterium]MBQ9562973.1 hypothetical protein [Lachnospiraceae bacterium]MBQ9592772.1 hypothetical protein [Lachnospiraceae bacterium]MBR0152465.1 hypothetical protein [Lachnospiraceae bacterium]